MIHFDQLQSKSVGYGKGCVLKKCLGHKFYAGRYCITAENWILWLLNFIFFFRKSKCPQHWRPCWRYVLLWHLGKSGLLRNGKWLFQPCDVLQQLLCILTCWILHSNSANVRVKLSVNIWPCVNLILCYRWRSQWAAVRQHFLDNKQTAVSSKKHFNNSNVAGFYSGITTNLWSV